MNKVQTINLKGNEYALVPERLKAFRELNPRADIQSKPTWNDDGSLDFMTRIIVDQANEHSAKGTGWAHCSAEELKQPKAYEKTQTISKGRALADVGYLNNGQIATTEEMAEFEEFRQENYEQAILDIRSATKREEFTEILSRLNNEQKKLATPVVNERIKELKDANASKS